MRTGNSTWHRCAHFRTQLRLKEEDKNFKPTRAHIPIQISKYSNNQIHYRQQQQRAAPRTKPKYQPFTKWDAQIKQQLEWMQNLIKHVDFNRLTAVLTAVDESDHMIIVSDGSGNYFKMTFGWIMSQPEG